MFKKYLQMITVARFRKTFQGMIVFLLVAGPFFQIIRTFRQDPPSYLNSPVFSNSVFHALIGAVDHPLRNFLDYFYRDITGGPYSLKIYFLHMVEPLTAAVYTLANLFQPDAWNLYVFFSFLIPLAAAFVFGRVFCGYVCPMSLVVSLNMKIQKKYFQREPQGSASPAKLPGWNKWYFYAILAVIMLQPMILPYILPPAIFQHAAADFVLFGGLTMWGVSFIALFLFEAWKPAYFCRNLCPTGLFLTGTGKKRLLRIEYQPGTKCQTGCHLCNEVCWLGLNPKGHVDDPACDLCNRCVEHCPTDRLVVALAGKKKDHKPPTAPLLLLVAGLGLTGASRVYAVNYLGYDKPSSFSTLVERSLTVMHNSRGTKMQLYYSVVASDKTRMEGGQAALHVHMQLDREMYAGPVRLSVSTDDGMVAEQLLETVNYPVSILKPSVYRLPFNFIPDKQYRFEIIFPDNTCKNLTIYFRYPEIRL